MILLLVLLFATASAAAVDQQADDTKIVHGWVPSPTNRGTWSILWSCFATILLCTWSALHLNIPTKHTQRHLIGRKLGYMLIAALAPELFTVLAIEEWVRARDFLRKLRRHGEEAWTMSHLHFLQMDGFVFEFAPERIPDTDASSTSSHYSSSEKLPTNSDIEDLPSAPQTYTFSNDNGRFLASLASTGNLPAPPITPTELASLSRSDPFVKTIAVVQITWLVLEAILRAVQHLQVTALEILCCAFVFCSFTTYVFSWSKPQDVEHPVRIYLPPKNAILQRTNSSDSSVNGNNGPTFNALFGDLRLSIIYILLFVAFGSIHCLAWDGQFPTWQEHLAWRICSASTTALPLVYVLIWTSEEVCRKRPGAAWLGGLWAPLSYSVGAIYTLARVSLISLSFASLRALPESAYLTVRWAELLPHAGG